MEVDEEVNKKTRGKARKNGRNYHEGYDNL